MPTTLLGCPAELSSETKRPHFVAFQLHAATAHLEKPHWLCIHPHTHLFYLTAQVKLHLQLLRSPQVLGDNSSDLRHYSLLQGKKKKYSPPLIPYILRKIWDPNCAQSLLMALGFLFFPPPSNQNQSVDCLISMPAGKLTYKKQSFQRLHSLRSS